MAKQNSNAALAEAQEALADQTQQNAAAAVAPDESEAAEQKLAQQLATTIPAVKNDVVVPPPEPQPLRGAVSVDQWKTRTEQEASEPTLGGTLNATTEQAEDDKRREIEDDRNKVILSHGGSYTTSEPSFQSPLNAAAAEATTEPEARDIFAENEMTAPTNHAEAIQPPAPALHAPTLAEIDAQARAAHEDARAAIDAALAPTPSSEPQVGLPPLPPLPPMPDFSTLPPLPSDAPIASPAPDMNSINPPTPLDSGVSPQSDPHDPSQFHIPGQ